MSGIAVIVNPHAGGNRRGSKRSERFEKILRDQGRVWTPTTLPELDYALGEALEGEPDVLALCGGDGSYFRAFSILRKRLGSDPWPQILPLPAGTINNLTHAIRSHSSTPERLLAEVVHDHQQGIAHELADCDLFTVNDEHVGYVFGAGMIVNFLRAYYANPDPGRLSAALLILRLVFSASFRGPLQAKIFQPFEADMLCDGERVPHRAFRMLIGSCVSAIGLGFEPFYLAGRKPGQFHVLGGPASALALIRRLRRFFHGWPARHAELYDNLAAELVVEFSRPTWYTVNGDLVGPDSRVVVRRYRRITVVRG